MFDTRSASDVSVVDSIVDSAHAENREAARRLAWIGELVARRCSDDEHAHWACDAWDAAVAEVSAALGLTSGRASNEMLMATALRHRLPRVAELFLAGSLSYRVCEAITDRTYLIRDRETLMLVDTAIAQDAQTWGALSTLKLQRAIDFWVNRYDPGAVRQVRSRSRDRDVIVTVDPGAGTAEIIGRLSATDGELVKRTLTRIAYSVCDDDPRTMAQRRSDAMGAMAAGADRLACLCDNPDCPAADQDGRAASVVVHVLADADVLESVPDPDMHGEGPEPGPVEWVLRDDEPAAVPESASPRGATGVMTGNRGIVPAPLLAELIKAGATVRPLRRPKDQPEPQYRPSTALDEWVRMRDMTCRFPNCDVPAELCDVDHTIAWPFGPTHPSNLACKCRKHHLLKTFWAGWSDRQNPDGTIVWTSPTGRTYTTRPGSHLLMPTWNTTTATLPPPTGQPPTAIGTMMPTRRTTRAAQRAQRITAERKLNDARVAERTRPPPF
ncbi:HNH endonuclease [Mycolicibacterium crocinum]|uniref:HNH endonuclease n=1 Tax=Mycolicibacterium crocinum TaxID=388459 RepID=A0ABY3TN74_9MYCO|nr:HNH endonuclease signature motif containing protein [Mycolicibacterium crocinum]ULN41354.1 HNH endonuclease [Mycolicibacterium crocinum]